MSPGWFDYYTAPKEAWVQIATLAAYNAKPLMLSGADVDICGLGWNCSYTINFTAPGYKCTEVANGADAAVNSLGAQKPPKGLTTDLLLPTGNYSYYTYAFGSEYSGAQMNESWPGGMPVTKPPYPKNLGAWRTEPVIWFGYVTRAGEGEMPKFRNDSRWDEWFVPKVAACENWETDYVVRFNLEGQAQTTEVMSRRFLHKLIK